MIIPRSDHAMKRFQQRNLKSDEIDFVIEHGKRVHNAGAIFYQMWRKCIPRGLPPNDRFHRLVGVTVIVCPYGKIVITAYLNPKAFKRDRIKRKYNRQVGGRCANCPFINYCNDWEN